VVGPRGDFFRQHAHEYISHTGHFFTKGFNMVVITGSYREVEELGERLGWSRQQMYDYYVGELERNNQRVGFFGWLRSIFTLHKQ
jgi:hypothetical protein